jgi:hypothetical protein
MGKPGKETLHRLFSTRPVSGMVAFCITEPIGDKEPLEGEAMQRYTAGLAALAATALSFTQTSASGVPPGTAGILDAGASEPIFASAFEHADPGKLPKGYRLERDPARNGKQVLSGEISQPNKHLGYHIPFSGLSGRGIEVSFFARSPDGTRCAVWLQEAGGKRRSIGMVGELPKAWKEYHFRTKVATDGNATVEIVAPSSWGGTPGKALLDDIVLVQSGSAGMALDLPEDFPALCGDAVRGSWLAVVARDGEKPHVIVSRVLGAERRQVISFQPDGTTGIGMPAVAEWSKGCVVCVPVEREDKWRIACLYIARQGDKPAAVHYLDAGGSANIDPAVDMSGDMALVVWEGNAEFPRRIYAAQVTPAGASPATAISPAGMPACNPDVVVLPENRGFAAWDAYDGDTVSIHGCPHRDGKWRPSEPITSDARIERHVDLAVRDGEVWLAWQAQSFKKHLVNGLDEQRVVVARLEDDGGLGAVPGVFEKVSPPGKLCVRPQLAFGTDGSLVVTLRESLGAQSGWRAMAWTYDGHLLRGPFALWDAQGRWRPIPMALHDGQLVAACQRDNLPANWGIDVGQAPDWKSEILLVKMPATGGGTAGALKTVPLSMPQTPFRLAEHTENFSCALPSARATHRGTELKLYWGDMHEHSDLSVCQRAKNPPLDDLWANQRDIEQLDFTAITDHGYNLDHPQWFVSAERVRAHFDAGRFVSLLAEEWTSDHVHYDPKRSVRRYGHRNLIFEDPYLPKWHDSRDKPPQSPRAVWDRLGETEFISIPHQIADTGNSPTDWTHHDEHHQPLAEIFQQRESYEYLGAPRQSRAATPFKGHFLQDAWALGLVIGVIASPDHGGGKGKAAVWARDLTRESLFEAFHARHAFGTSGAKMVLWVSSGEHMMGDKAVHTGGSIPFTIRASADRPVSRVVLLRNNAEVFVSEPGTDKVELTWEDSEAPADTVLWYYVRVHRDDDELAWSSPIWFFPDSRSLEATVDHARNLSRLHPEGPPSDDPGPGVNWRAKMKKRYK